MKIKLRSVVEITRPSEYKEQPFHCSFTLSTLRLPFP